MSVEVERFSPSSPHPPLLSFPPEASQAAAEPRKSLRGRRNYSAFVASNIAASVANAMLSDSTAAQSSRIITAAASATSPPSSVSLQATRLSSLAARREGLKLNFHRSISEPLGQSVNGVISPPSCGPSLHPSKRCKMMMLQDSPTPTTNSTARVRPSPLTLPSISMSITSPKSTSPNFLVPLPPSRLSKVGDNDVDPVLNNNVNILNNRSGTLLRPPQSITAGSVSLPSSPCGESSTMQRTILLKNARTIDHNSLALKINSLNCNAGGNTSSFLKSSSKNGHGFLLIDCRPFIAYNVNHIRGAINVNCCDRFNRKRLQQGKATLADLATTKEGKELLKKRNWREVVVYDDCSDSLEDLPASHTLFLVMNALVEDNREPIMLLGGLRDFQVSHKAFCEDHLMQSAAPSMSPASSMSVTSSTSSSCLSIPSASSIPMALSPTNCGSYNGNDMRCNQNLSSPLLPDLPSPTDICDTKDIENHPATQVLPHLFLGNMRDASDASVLHRLGIGYVLNVTAKPPEYKTDPGIHYKQLVAADNGLQNIRQFFEEAFEFIDLAKTNNSGVLIHCQAGISRSPTIAVAYLMKHVPMAMSDAYKFVKTKRSIISPNLNFMGQLWEFEQGLRLGQDDETNNQIKTGSNNGHKLSSTSEDSSFSSSGFTCHSATSSLTDSGIIVDMGSSTSSGDVFEPPSSQPMTISTAPTTAAKESLVAAINNACGSSQLSTWSNQTSANSSSDSDVASSVSTKGCGV